MSATSAKPLRVLSRVVLTGCVLACAALAPRAAAASCGDYLAHPGLHLPHSVDAAERTADAAERAAPSEIPPPYRGPYCSRQPVAPVPAPAPVPPRPTLPDAAWLAAAPLTAVETFGIVRSDEGLHRPAVVRLAIERPPQG